MKKQCRPSGASSVYSSVTQRIRDAIPLIRRISLSSTLTVLTAIPHPVHAQSSPPQTGTPVHVLNRESRGVGTRRESEPPRYVVDSGGPESLYPEKPAWLDLGLEYRLRYEYRDGDLRRSVIATDNPFLHRTRAYLGVREKLDPFRLGIEVAEARRSNSQFAADDRDVNHFDILQSFGELHFGEALSGDLPLRIQGGRLAMEYLDRRLIARNEWRNTTNTFQGVRVIMGDEKSDWQLDLLALEPVLRDPEAMDQPDNDRKLYAAIGDWRRFSQISTLQPYYFFLDQHGDSDRPMREIHTLGLRSFGVYGTPGFDYDLDLATQFGHSDQQIMRAFAFSAESGYTFNGADKRRISLFLGYASGDRNPNDGRDQHFERLAGFSRPWSANDYISWENVFTPKTRLEFQPTERVRVDSGYSAFWLASADDVWANTGLRDREGNSGKFLGHEIDIRSRFQISKKIDLTLGYSHFFSGGYTTMLGRANNTDFFYCETSLRFL